MATIYSNGIVVTKAAVSITTTTVYYALSADGSCPDISEFTPEIKTISADFPYLWSYTVIEKSNNTKDETKPTLIGSFGVDGKSPMAVILSSESFVFPCDSDGIGADYSTLVVAVTLIQGSKTLTSVNVAPTEKGTFMLTAASDDVTFLECKDNYVSSTSGTVLRNDSGYITLTIFYIDFDGESGSCEKKISLIKQKQGKTGAYEKKQYCLSDSKTEAPTEGWTENMPNIVNSLQYLWIRYKLVPTGGNEDEIEWSDPVVSNVGIAVTESKIGLSADGTQLAIGEDTILLDAPKVLVPKSLTANEVDGDNFFGKEFIVKKGGSIRSQNYSSYDGSSEGKGFRLDGTSGSGEMNDITLGGNAVVRGTIQNNVLRTVKTASGGKTYTSPSWSGGTHWLSTELFALLKPYIPTDEVWTKQYVLCSYVLNGVVVSHVDGDIFYFFNDNTFCLGHLEEIKYIFGDSDYSRVEDYTFSPSLYYSDSLQITLPDGTVVFQAGPLYDTWIGATEYALWRSGLTDMVGGKTTSSGNLFKGSPSNDKNVIIGDYNISVEGVGAISTEYFVQSEWPSYSLTLLSENLGVYGSDFLPMTNDESSLGNGTTQRFKELWVKNLHASDLIDLIYPIGSIYLSMKNLSPASFLGGTWQALGGDYSFWTQNVGNNNGDTDLNYGSVTGGLPDIEGEIVSNNEWSVGNNDTCSNSGALEGRWFSRYTSSGTSSSNTYMGGIHFRASKYNSGSNPYGKTEGTTVRPTAYKIFAWRRTA